jgi:hypothetical protein
MVVDDTFGSNSDFLTFLDTVKPIIFKIIKKIPFITLPSCNFEDANYCIFNSDTYAGFRYDKYLKQPSKESARESAKIIAKRRWQYIETCSRKKEEIKRDKIFAPVATGVININNLLFFGSIPNWRSNNGLNCPAMIITSRYIIITHIKY